MVLRSRLHVQLGGRLRELLGAGGIEVQGDQPARTVLRNAGGGVGNVRAFDECRFQEVLRRTVAGTRHKPLRRIRDESALDVRRLRAVDACVGRGQRLGRVTLLPTLIGRGGGRRVRCDNGEVLLVHCAEVQCRSLLEHVGDALFAHTWHGNHDRGVATRTLRRHLSLGDTESVHTLADDVHGLLQLRITDRPSGRLGGQSHLRTAPKIQTESRGVIGSREPGPHGKCREEDHEDPERPTVLRAW